MRNLILLLLVSGGVAACGNGAPAQAPTHRWVSNDAADQIQYRNDHARCETMANVDATNGRYEADSDTFAIYKRCMVERGYQLTAHTGHE